jgi:hypothetical protein
MTRRETLQAMLGALLAPLIPFRAAPARPTIVLRDPDNWGCRMPAPWLVREDDWWEFFVFEPDGHGGETCIHDPGCDYCLESPIGMLKFPYPLDHPKAATCIHPKWYVDVDGLERCPNCARLGPEALDRVFPPT